jgi:hypothetical protein
MLSDTGSLRLGDRKLGEPVAGVDRLLLLFSFSNDLLRAIDFDCCIASRGDVGNDIDFFGEIDAPRLLVRRVNIVEKDITDSLSLRNILDPLMSSSSSNIVPVSEYNRLSMDCLRSRMCSSDSFLSSCRAESFFSNCGSDNFLSKR